MKWVYNENIDIFKNEGFIYRITNIHNNKFYIGKKSFWSKCGKSKKESNWKKYLSSNKELIEDIKNLGEKSFIYEILEICKSKRILTYKEVYWQFKFDVLFCNSYNCNILGKFFRGNLK